MQMRGSPFMTATFNSSDLTFTSDDSLSIEYVSGDPIDYGDGSYSFPRNHEGEFILMIARNQAIGLAQ
jgi:hypothetical protein